MKLFNSMTFKIMMLAIAGVLLTTIVLIVSVAISERKAEQIILHNKNRIEEQNIVNMKPIAQGVYNSLQIYDKILLSKLNDGMVYMREKFQTGKDLTQIVDDVSRLHEVHATIFSRQEDGSMLRTATSIVRNGKRFVNTKIYPKNEDGSTNAVIETVIKGKRYVGRANEGGEWVNAIYEPIVEKGEVKGMLFVGSLPSDTKSLVEIIRNLNYGEKGSVFAVGGKGLQKGILPISINGEMDNQNGWDLTNSHGEYYWRKIIEKGGLLLGNSTEYLEVDYVNRNREEYKLSIVEMYYAPWDWVIGVSIPKEEIEKSSQEMQDSLNEAIDTLKKQAYSTGVVMFILILIISFVYSKNLTKKIKLSIVLFDKVAQGDMTHRLENSKDEIGKMARHFNRLMDNMHEFIKKVTHDAANLNMTSEELFSVSGQVENVAEKIVTRSNMIASTTEQMVMMINVIASTIERMSANMKTSARTMREMNESINKITNNVEKIHQITLGAKNKVTNATKVISNLGMAAREIGEVTEMIKRIAEKTNILALNATIEAAYAGEAGKGFVIVADEIKELASQSTDSANYITQRIESIQNGTSNAVEVIHDVSEIIVDISDSVEAITGYSGTGTASIVGTTNNVEQTNSMAKDVANTINEIALHSNEISRNVSEVARGVANVNSNVVDMNQISEEIKQGSVRVHKKSQVIEKIATEFKQMLHIYKV